MNSTSLPFPAPSQPPAGWRSRDTRQSPRAAPQYRPVPAGERAGDTGNRNNPRIPSRSGLAAGTNHSLVRAWTFTPDSQEVYLQKTKRKKPFYPSGKEPGLGATGQGHCGDTSRSLRGTWHLCPEVLGWQMMPHKVGVTAGAGWSIKPLPNPRCCGCLQHPPADSTPGALLTNVHQLTPCHPSATPEAAGAPGKEELDGLGSIQGLGTTPWG